MISAFRHWFQDTQSDPPPRNRIAMLAISLGIFVLSFALGSWNNSFPYYYHLDEPLEVWMVIHGTTNFHHPLLMGNTTDLVATVLGAEREPQTIVEIGRWCMAFFGAVACLAFSWIGYRYAGLLGGLAAGVFVAMHPLLVEVVHYYKEDPALLMGVGLSFLALSRFWDRPSNWHAVALGAANAVAFSGKYIGIVMVIFSFVVMAAARPRQYRLVQFGLFLALFVTVVGVINYQLVAGAGQLFDGVGREVALLGDGGKGKILTNKYVAIFEENSSYIVTIFALWYVARLLLQPKGRTLPEYLMAVFPLAFGLMLSLTPKTAERYFLPASATICLLAGIGLADFCRQFRLLKNWPARRRHVLYSILLLSGIGFFTPTVVDRLTGFGIDARRLMAEWIEENVPSSEVIVQDRRVQLVAVSGKSKKQRAFTLPHRILSNQYAADFGTVQELQDKHIRYVALMVDQKYKNHPSARVKNRAEYDQFVDEVETRGELLWKSVERTPRILHPRIALYRLPDPENP